MAELETTSAGDLREQQLALGRVLRAVARGEGLQPVLDELIAEASRLCGGEYGELHLVEGDVLRAFSYYVAGDLDSPIVRSAAEQWEIGRSEPHQRDRSTLAGRVALLEDVVLMPDMLADPEYTYPLPAGTRAGLGVPIVLDGELIGTIGIVRDVSLPFTSDDVDLVKTFADQAAVAIKNARLLETVQRQLDQQRAIGDVLRAITRSSGLQTVLDEIVETVSVLCGGDNVRMWLVRDGLLHAVANGGWTDGWEYDQEHPHPIDRGSASGRAAMTKEAVHISDFDADPEYVYEGPVSFGVNLSVPILLDGEVTGVFGIVRADPTPFSDDVIELVQTFADQAAVAIANAKLLDAVERRLDQQEAIADVLRVVARSEGLPAVFAAVVEAARRLSGGNSALLYLVDGDVLRVAAHAADEPPEAFEHAKQNPHRRDRSSLVGRVALENDVVQIPDVFADPEYGYEAPPHIRSLLGVPISLDGELIGAIAISGGMPVAFSDEIVGLVKTFADQAAIAIANARLLEAVERQLEQQRAVGDVLSAVARSEGLETVFANVVDAATKLCHGDYGALYMKEGDVLRVQTQHHGQPALYEYEREHAHTIDNRTVIGRAALTRSVAHIPDTRADPDYDWGGAGVTEYRSLLGAPILVDGELIGAINVVRVDPEPFGEEHIELMKTFADQAAIAIANARLIESIERQLEHQQSISDVFATVARSEGLELVFQEAIGAATQLCGGEYGGLYILEDGVFQARAYSGAAEQFEYEREHPHTLDRKTLVGRVGLTREVVHIPDLKSDPEYEWALLLGHRAGLGVPISIEGELIGAIAITREPEPFTDEQIDLVKTFADQAAIAISNARLIDAVQRQLEQQRAVADVLGIVARTKGLDAVFHAVLETAARLCSAEYGQLCIVDGDVLRLVVSHGTSDELREYELAHPSPVGRSTVVGRVALTRDVVHIPDVLEDPEYEWQSQEIGGFRAMLGVPIFIEDELIGVINVVRDEPGPFSDEHVALVKTFADQAAIAIANTRLLESVERQRTELSRFVSPQVAELVSSEDGQKMLTGHRAYVTSMFCDLRGFTSFTELAEPEELFEVLREYHIALGELIPRYQGTLEHFAGDGLMVFFNDPLPVENHELKAVELALAAQERFEELASTWRKRGHDLGLGIGIAAGYATLGRIGFEGRYDYGVLGPVTNLASRLSTHAEPGQTLISQRVYAAVEERCDAHEIGALELKGFGRPMPAYEVRGLTQA